MTRMDGTRRADSRIQAGGGHEGHLEGGAEIMWRQVGHLTMALREMCDQVDRLRAYTCPDCGRPATSEFTPGVDASPFLQTVISQEAVA